MMRGAVLLLSGVLLAAGCKTKADPGPPVPASSEPAGKDLVEGAVVAAFEKGGGVRLYKVIQVNYFPPPMGDEIVFVAYHQKGNDFVHAARLWRQGGLTVALPKVRVQRPMFRQRDYRVIDQQPVTDADRNAKREEPKPRKAGP